MHMWTCRRRLCNYYRYDSRVFQILLSTVPVLHSTTNFQNRRRNVKTIRAAQTSEYLVDAHGSRRNNNYNITNTKRNTKIVVLLHRCSTTCVYTVHGEFHCENLTNTRVLTRVRRHNVDFLKPLKLHEHGTCTHNN